MSPFPPRHQNLTAWTSVSQGIVNLNDNGPNDGGLLVLDGSHKLMRKHFEETGRTETRSWGPVDWAGFEPEEEEWFFERGCKWVKVGGFPFSLLFLPVLTCSQIVTLNRSAPSRATSSL